MKTIISAGRDFILYENTKVIYVDNKAEYTDKEKNLANHRGNVQSITWYEDEYFEGYPTGKANKLSISADEVKKLYAAIIEIESKRSVETYYPGMDF